MVSVVLHLPSPIECHSLECTFVKLVLALWGPDHSALLSEPLRASLRAAGATRLQVNLDDEHVVPAMRIPHEDPPVGAVVSVWGGGAAEVTSALAAVTSRVAGWHVEERRPIAPPEVWDGSRTDALANVAVLRRPAELDEPTWRHRWLVDHTPVAISTQGTFGYLQNVVGAPVTDGAPAVAALVEELFPTAGMTDVHAFYGSGGDDAELHDRITRLMTSVARFGADRDLDLVPTSRYLFDLAGASQQR